MGGPLSGSLNFFVSYTINKSKDQGTLVNMNKLSGSRFKLKDHIITAAALLGFLVVANLSAYFFVSNERWLYSWDHVGYWDRSSTLAELLSFTPYEALKRIVYSVWYDDYNLVPAIPISILMSLLNDSRLTYILGIVNLYAVPVLLTLMMLYRVFWKDRDGQDSSFVELVPIVVVLTFPLFWVPILAGYLDVGGLVIINLTLLLYFSTPLLEQRLKELIAIGVLLSILVLFRRWYAFWSVSFLITILLEAIILAYIQRRLGLRGIWQALRPFVTISTAAASFLVLAAWPLVQRMLHTDYADIYSAYKETYGIFSILEVITNYFGLFYSGVFVLSSLILLFAPRTRRIVVLLCVQLGILIVHFSSMQDFDSHQYYLLQPAVLLIISLGIGRIIYLYSNTWARTATALLYLTPAVVSCLAVFVVHAKPHTLIDQIVPSPRVYPKVRNDFTEIQRMLSVLDAHLANSNAHVYMLASSENLNNSLLRFVNKSVDATSAKFESVTRVLPVSDVDKRDGFPSSLLQAQYVLVAWPVQYHLRPEDQRVIGLPADAIYNSRNIGKAFRKLPYTFVLDRGVQAFLFEKTRPISTEELRVLCEQFRQAYPDRPDLFTPKL